ncbi:MAG: biotin--[acetyl-CoA-carboxylase] ligase [Desulfamplus sp.]|nr:biotin--[acetyl-CoA-carboxylase] ligase [Desulfamplus sp.]
MLYDFPNTDAIGSIKLNKTNCSESNVKKRDADIYCFETLTSTMDKARKLARNNAPHLSVVVAKEQTKGRGRLNRTWVSERGGLWFTIILRPKLPPPLAFQVNFAASLSLAKTLKQKYELDVSVKWPNDILFKDKKLAGLLSELETDEDAISFVNIGIGINVNNNPDKDQPNAVSIKNILSKDSGEEISQMDLLYSFLDYFENQLMDISIEESLSPQPILQSIDNTQQIQIKSARLIEQWKKMTSTIGRQVRIETFDGIYEGVAVDIDESGALIINDENGIEKRVIYGDCFYQ